MRWSLFFASHNQSWFLWYDNIFCTCRFTPRICNRRISLYHKHHTREFKSAIPKVDIDGINDEIDKKVDVIANHDRDLFSAAEDLHGDGRRQDEIESNDHPTHETVEAQSDQELDNADELMDIDKQIEELMKKRKDLE